MNKPSVIPTSKQLALNEKQLKLPGQHGSFRQFLGNYWFLLLCMAIPAVLMYLMYFSREIYPIGDGSVLVLDLNGQ